MLALRAKVPQGYLPTELALNRFTAWASLILGELWNDTLQLSASKFLSSLIEAKK